MGQAKRRGTFEDRLAQALDRDSNKPTVSPPAIIYTDDPESKQVARAMRRRGNMGGAMLIASLAALSLPRR